LPTDPLGSGDEDVITRAATTDKLKVRVAVADALSITATLKEDVVLVEGVPEIKPLVDRLSPEDSAPETKDQMYGDAPPTALSARLYGVPTDPLASITVL